MTEAGSLSSGSAWTSSSSVLRSALVVLLVCSCVRFVNRAKPLSPEEAARGYTDRLKAVRSFAFHLSYHTDVPFPIGAEFFGTRQENDREEWNGTWTRGGEKSKVALRAAGPVQYEYDNGRWRRTQRGVETRILDQLEPVVKGSRLAFVKTEGGRHWYQFAPEVPILDPTQTRKLTGVIEIDVRSGLPRRVYCSDSARTAEWSLLLGRFNRAGRVQIPFVPVQTIKAVPARRLSRSELYRAEKTVGARLRRLDPEAEVAASRGGLLLRTASRLSDRQVELLLTEGKAEVRAATLCTGLDTTGTVRVGDDAATRVALGRVVAGPGALTAELVAEVPVRPGLGLTSRKSDSILVEPGEDMVLAFLLDGAVLSVTRGLSAGRMVFYDLGSEELVAAMAGVVDGGVLPARFRVAAK